MVFDHQGWGHPKPVYVVLIWQFTVQIFKILSKNTIVKVGGVVWGGGSGVWSKTILLRF